MNHLFIKCLSFIAVSVVFALPLAAESHPNFSGTWKLDEDTNLASLSAVHGTVFQIEHKDPTFKYTASGMRGMSAFTETYSFTTDGKPSAADPGKPGVVARWEGTTLTLQYVKDGKELARFLFRLSADGKQMTREAELSGNRKIREVYTRQ